MDVSDARTSLLVVELVWRAQHRGRTCILQVLGIFFSRFLRIRGWLRRRAEDRAEIHSPKVETNQTERQITRNMPVVRYSSVHDCDRTADSHV
jgi:hypothetical protein